MNSLNSSVTTTNNTSHLHMDLNKMESVWGFTLSGFIVLPHRDSVQSAPSYDISRLSRVILTLNQPVCALYPTVEVCTDLSGR